MVQVGRTIAMRVVELFLVNNDKDVRCSRLGNDTQQGWSTNGQSRSETAQSNVATGGKVILTFVSHNKCFVNKRALTMRSPTTRSPPPPTWAPMPTTLSSGPPAKSGTWGSLKTASSCVSSIFPILSSVWVPCGVPGGKLVRRASVLRK